MSPFVYEWLFRHAEETPDRAAVGTPGSWTSYRQLARLTRSLAARFAARGLGPGEFLLSSLPPGPVAVAGSLAAQSLGACAVELARDTEQATLEAIIRQTGARAALVSNRDAAAWAELARTHRLHLAVVHGEPVPERLAALLAGISWEWLPEQTEVPDAAWSPPSRAATDPALLVYTSGSTGTPRGVVHTHANIEANTRAIVQYLELTAQDRALSILPLFYCYGKSILQTHLMVGASVFFDHRFLYPRRVMEAIAEENCTGFAGVPLTFELLRQTVDLGALRLSTLRYVTQAGGAMHPDTIRWVRQVFAPARLFVMYGQTEATARLSYLPPELATAKEGSVGRGLMNVELRVVDDRGTELAPGQVGQLVARGPSVTPGYFRDPEATAEILRDGWLWTGDLARRDEDGFLYLTGRAREVLKLGGHRVSPVEIEQALALHPDVAEAVVVGAPDPTGGEAAVAFVVPRSGRSPSEEELRRFCRTRLAQYKVPREVRSIEALPRTASGKVARMELQSSVSRLGERFSKQVLELDLEKNAAELCERLHEVVLRTLRRRGVVVAVSGGIDSACVAALATRALGARHVHALLLPERDSASESTAYGRKLCEKLGIGYELHDIGPVLEAAGCYARRNAAVKSVFPEFTPDMAWKIVMHGDRLGSDALNLFYVVVRTPDGREHRVRLTPSAYLEIVAATNFKQRVRKTLEYFHADRLIYAVAGTPNRLEYDQGFFVKLGDGAADVKPIASLYKTQVYALARHLGVIDEILRREPTTDTYSLEQSQEDFYFSVHYRTLDLLLWAKNHGTPAKDVARELELAEEQVLRVYQDIDQKRRATAYLHAPPLLLEPVPELAPFALGNHR